MEVVGFGVGSVGLLAGGLAAVPGKFELTVQLTRIVMPFLVLVAVAAACMGMLNSLNVFFVPALSPAMFNIASIAGLVPLRLQCAYVAAKAGVVNLTKAMALELGPHGILVNGIAPGSTLTEGTRALFYGEGGLFHDSVKQMLAHVPLGRPGTVEEIAVAAVFLADPENSYMNGHILTVDGGWTAGYTRDF